MRGPANVQTIVWLERLHTNPVGIPSGGSHSRARGCEPLCVRALRGRCVIASLVFRRRSRPVRRLLFFFFVVVVIFIAIVDDNNHNLGMYGLMRFEPAFCLGPALLLLQLLLLLLLLLLLVVLLLVLLFIVFFCLLLFYYYYYYYYY